MDVLVTVVGNWLVINMGVLIKIIKEVSSFMSFEEGDVLMTGTPKGVGQLLENDRFTGRIFQGEILLIEQHWTVEG